MLAHGEEKHRHEDQELERHAGGDEVLLALRQALAVQIERVVNAVCSRR